MKVLIPGIAGQLGQMVALRCRELGHEVAGIDRRRWPEAFSVFLNTQCH